MPDPALDCSRMPGGPRGEDGQALQFDRRKSDESGGHESRDKELNNFPQIGAMSKKEDNGKMTIVMELTQKTKMSRVTLAGIVVFILGLMSIATAIQESGSIPESGSKDQKSRRQGRKYPQTDFVKPFVQPEQLRFSSSKRGEELLNDILNFGLNQSELLLDKREKDLYYSGMFLTKKNPAHFIAVFNKQKNKAKELAKWGYATLQASSLLSKQ